MSDMNEILGIPVGLDERDVDSSFFEENEGEDIQPGSAPHQKRCIAARETISTESFMAEHRHWLNHLLEARPNRSELLPFIFRHITKDTTRVLPVEYHQALYQVFLDMGDSVRINWCLEPRTNIITILRDIPIPPRSDFKRYMDNAVRLWYVGDRMIREDNIGGTELMRMSTEFIVCLNFFSQKEAFLKDQMKIIRAAADRASKIAEQRVSNATEILASVRAEMEREEANATEQTAIRDAGANPDPAAHLREARDRLIRGLDDTQSDGQL